MSEASPRPWRVEPMFNGVADARGEKIAANISDADAALIVDAVNAIEATKKLSIQLYNPIRRAEDERDRLRDLVRRLADLSESLLANYEYRYREDPNSMAFVGNARDFIREARAAIGEDAK